MKKHFISHMMMLENSHHPYPSRNLRPTLSSFAYLHNNNTHAILCVSLAGLISRFIHKHTVVIVLTVLLEVVEENQLAGITWRMCYGKVLGEINVSQI